MASNYSALPQDITDLIVDELANLRADESDTHDLYNCSLVSSTFRERSQSRLWEFMKIVSSTDKAGIAKNAQIRRILETDTHIASYVRSAHFSFAKNIAASLPGFEGPPLILPNLRELKITKDGGVLSLRCNGDIFPELLEEIKNLMRSPGLETLMFRCTEPPMEVIRTLSHLKHLELRPELVHDTPFIALPTRSSRVSRRSPPTPNYLDTIVSLDPWFQPDLVLLFAEQRALKAEKPLELSMTRVENYIVYTWCSARTESIQHVLDCIDSNLLRSFSVRIEVTHVPLSFSLSSFPNLDTLGFAWSGPRPVDYDKYLEYSRTLERCHWSFIRRTLLSLPPSNKLATLCLTLTSKDDFLPEEWSQVDAFLSDRIHFKSLKRVFISLPSQHPTQLMPSLFAEGIVSFPHCDDV
ncbi:hypothetical protein DXG01_008977 [Tephrocybe rancida]|nr:hypothetical protein DXG01_008977 [Tephrocybe rancida]